MEEILFELRRLIVGQDRLLMRTFADGNGDGIGDFRGLANRVPYLARLGVTCVWLLPFYASPECDDGYDVSFQPDLNLKNATLREEIERIMSFWLELGVSGFRVDAVPFMIEAKTRMILPAGPRQYEYLADFRRFLSWRRGYAMMLAEANVLPEEVPNYFGNGDRMHLLFNFWVNQRFFLAAADEDAGPLQRAWLDLPELPPTAQWAEFLRVHDELDLGRLSPEERERCYAAFAPDPNMRLYERGIRRRLASMLGGDRRRIELMNSLMFTLQGTPVVRYGEEIGMGEDLRLPERYAIRTPMQWSADRNAGFSTAPPEKLIRPVICEGEFSYKRVTVAAQRLDNNSLLNWTERVIRARTLVAIHNFSHAACSVRVEWPENTQGIERVFGRCGCKPLNGVPPVVDLDAYDYQWLRLRGCGAGETGQPGSNLAPTSV